LSLDNCGKEYNREPHEIISMGMQYMYKDPTTFAKTDPDYFKLIYMLMHHRD